MDDGVNILGFMQQYVLPCSSLEVEQLEGVAELNVEDTGEVGNTKLEKRKYVGYKLRTGRKRKSAHADISQQSDNGNCGKCSDKEELPPKKCTLDSDRLKQKLSRLSRHSRVTKFHKCKQLPSSNLHSQSAASNYVIFPGIDCNIKDDDLPSNTVSFESLKEELSRKNGSECNTAESSTVGLSHALDGESVQSDVTWCLDTNNQDGGTALLDNFCPVNESPMQGETVDSKNGIKLCKSLQGEITFYGNPTSSIEDQNPHVFTKVHNHPCPSHHNSGSGAIQQLVHANQVIAKLQLDLSTKERQMHEFAKNLRDLAGQFVELSNSFHKFVSHMQQ